MDTWSVASRLGLSLGQALGLTRFLSLLLTSLALRLLLGDSGVALGLEVGICHSSILASLGSAMPPSGGGAPGPSEWTPCNCARVAAQTPRRMAFCCPLEPPIWVNSSARARTGQARQPPPGPLRAQPGLQGPGPLEVRGVPQRCSCERCLHCTPLCGRGRWLPHRGRESVGALLGWTCTHGRTLTRSYTNTGARAHARHVFTPA